VFLILATLAAALEVGWGELFRHSGFNVAMACVVFAMGLALLGVFEIPIPGMIGSAAGGAQQEGPFGAFCTGILATLLATPCSGPFLGVTLFWSISQPAIVTYAVFTTMGLGMAFPYLALGMFPKAIKLLPRPGNWMVRLKEFAGFVLMGTVIFIVYFIDRAYTIPTLVMLLGIALGLWMIGNLYDINSHIRHKMLVRVTALALTATICGAGWVLTKPREHELPWAPFSESKLTALLAKRQTVLIDFTADW
jgi:thiol:disulfide interchange protein